MSSQPRVGRSEPKPSDPNLRCFSPRFARRATGFENQSFPIERRSVQCGDGFRRVRGRGEGDKAVEAVGAAELDGGEDAADRGEEGGDLGGGERSREIADVERLGWVGGSRGRRVGARARGRDIAIALERGRRVVVWAGRRDFASPRAKVADLVRPKRRILEADLDP